jgi:PKD repeat protein
MRCALVLIVMGVALLLGSGDASAQGLAPECPLEDFCCGNGVCDADENQSSCWRDCGRCPDGVCDVYEMDNQSCPADCGPICIPQGCTGRCGMVDDCGTPLDCGPCEGVCGNGVPDEGEDCANCPGDLAARPTFTVTPGSAGVGQTIVFQADPARIMNPPTPLWDMGNGDHRSGNPLSYSYSQPGQYNVRLTASEAVCGLTRVTNPKVVAVGSSTPDNQPPVARAGGPYNGRVLEAVLFDASTSTDPNGNGTIASYNWDFGDSTTGQGMVVSHAYQTERVYTVRLTVRDTQGLAGSATTTADIRGDVDGYFIDNQTLDQNPITDSLTARASMIILPPHSVTYEPRIRVTIRAPNGTQYDSGLVYDRYDRTFDNPAAGLWTMTVEYFFGRSGLPSPIPVGAKVTTRNVGATGPPPSIGGPREVWWLRGAFGSGNQRNEIQLSAIGGGLGSCTWSVDQGSSKVNLTSFGGSCSAAVTSRAASTFRDDVVITVTRGQRSSPHYVTVLTPYRLRSLGADFDGSFPPAGYISSVQYTTEDNFGAVVFGGLITESFAGVFNDYPGGNNWALPTAGTISNSSGSFQDRMSISCDPGSCSPMPVFPGAAGAFTRVRHISQSWWFEPAIRLQTNWQQWNLGHARHESVMSPTP